MALGILRVLELLSDQRGEEGAEAEEEVHGVHVGRGLPPPPDVQQEHVGGGVEGSVKQAEHEGVETHGQDGLVEGEGEGGEGVAEAADEEEEVGLGAGQAVRQEAGHHTACQTTSSLRQVFSTFTDRQRDRENFVSSCRFCEMIMI